MKRILPDLKVEILSAQFAELDNAWNYPKIYDTFSRIYFIEDGNGIIEHHNLIFDLKPGWLYLIPSHTTVKMYCPKYLTQYYIHFKAEILNGLSVFKLFTPFYQLSLHNRPYLPYLIYRLIGIWDKETIGETIESEAILRILLALFFPVGSEAEQESLQAFQRFECIFRYIDEHITNPITLKELAKLVNLQPTYFSNLFCSLIGIPPIQYLNRKRIEKAQILLLRTDDRLSEIACKTGYNDEFYFSRMFTKYTGMSPSKYRRYKQEFIV